MSRYLPEPISGLVEVGLETGEPQDRLIALGAANTADADWAPRTHFGAKVVEIFMDQFNLAFGPGAGKINTQGWGDYVTPLEAQIIRQVSGAVGEELEVQTRFYEFLGSAGANENFVLADGTMLQTISREFTADKPVLVKHNYGNNRSRTNFQNAVKAVKAFEGDDSWPSAFAQIRGLNEV